jgi:hypothetical protein
METGAAGERNGLQAVTGAKAMDGREFQPSLGLVELGRYAAAERDGQQNGCEGVRGVLDASCHLVSASKPSGHFREADACVAEMGSQ